MIEIKGLFNTAICYTPDLEEAAAAQIRAVCDQAAFASSKIRIMPDVHAGKGCTIGTTMTVTDKIVPGMVGVDIGCGMETVRLAERELDFAALDALIRREIPCGMEIRSVPHELNEQIDLGQLRCAPYVNLDRACRSIGTLGGGNHWTAGKTAICTWLFTPAAAIWASRSVTSTRNRAALPCGAERVIRSTN